MIIGKGKLRHVAAGLLGHFVSRNNHHERLWALGVLHTDVRDAGKRVALDLLHGRAQPEAPASSSLARSFAAFLRTALARHGATPALLSSATVAVEFGLPGGPRDPFDDTVFGEPFLCTVTLVSCDGKTVSRQARARCAPHVSRVFLRAMAMRDAGFKLHRHVIQRSGDCAGRWSLDVLREAYGTAQPIEFDLLSERSFPANPAGDSVARAYAHALRALLGEWMNELGTAALRLRFHSFARPPGLSVFAEVDLVARDGYTTWFNGGSDIHPPPPWEEAR